MKKPQLEGMVVLIAGAGHPPAPALALAFARLGAVVAVNDLSPSLLDPIVRAAQAESAPGEIRSYVADSTRGMPLRALIDEVLEELGRIDVLVNNPRIQPSAPFLELDEYDWQRTVEMNLNGPFMISQLVARLMRDQGGGVILNIVDTNPLPAGSAGRTPHAVTQAGLLALSREAAGELIAYNIRVHTLCPEPAVFNAPALSPSAVAAPVQAFSDLAVRLCLPKSDDLPGQVFDGPCQPGDSGPQTSL